MLIKIFLFLIFIIMLLANIIMLIVISISFFQQNFNIYSVFNLAVLIEKTVFILLGIFLLFIVLIIYFFKNEKLKMLVDRVLQPMPEWMGIIIILTFIAINLTFFFSPPLRVRPMATGWYIFHRFQMPEAITQYQAREYLGNSIRFYSLISFEMISSFCYIIWKLLQNLFYINR